MAHQQLTMSPEMVIRPKFIFIFKAEVGSEDSLTIFISDLKTLCSAVQRDIHQKKPSLLVPLCPITTIISEIGRRFLCFTVMGPDIKAFENSPSNTKILYSILEVIILQLKNSKICKKNLDCLRGLLKSLLEGTLLEHSLL